MKKSILTFYFILPLFLLLSSYGVMSQENSPASDKESNELKKDVKKEELIIDEKVKMDNEKDRGKDETGEAVKEDVVEEEEKPADKKIEKKEKKKHSGVSLYISYGAIIPVADYGEDYNAGHLVTLGTMLYRFNLWNISPAFHIRYNNYGKKEKSGELDANFNIIQITPGLVFKYDIKLPETKIAFFKNPLTFYFRIVDGVSVVMFEQDNSQKTTEYIHTLELSTGLTYPMYKMFELGFDFSYRMISTAGEPMHSLSVSLIIGLRL